MSLFAALDINGTTRYIGEVIRGAACGCFCAECKSPVVAKQGKDHVWHFAHEASQERPQCLPGSINLLRRLAMQRLLALDMLAMPECKAVVRDMQNAGIQEVATWKLPAGLIFQRDVQAATNKPVALLTPMGMPNCTIGLWVHIGEMLLDNDDHFNGTLVYQCPVPGKGEITTLAIAEDFLQRHGRWHWHKMPDVFGKLENAQQNVQARAAAHQTELLAKLQRLKNLHQERHSERGDHRYQQFRVPASSWLSDGGAGFSMPLQQAAPVLLPKWAALKKKNTSFFVFQMRDASEFWIVMEAADHPGYYIVPGTGWWDGWDEALPPSVGRADLEKGAYVSDKSINYGIQLMRNFGVTASRIDSDVGLICAFTGWKT